MGEPEVRTAAEAAALVREKDELGLPLGPGIPTSFVHALGARERFDELEVFGALLPDAFALFTRPGVRLRSGFFGPVERGLRASGFAVEFVPADFRRFAVILEQLAPRVMATRSAPPDADGKLSLSLHAGATVDALHATAADPDRLLIVEIHPDLPRTRGLPPEHPHALSIDEVDVLIESSHPVLEIAEIEPGDVERAIAEHVARFVPDGATLQTGIGGVPSQVALLLADGSGGDYGIHSEMFTTGLMKLHEAGKIGNRKGLYDGLSVCTFAGGTPELYAWLHENDEVCFLPVEEVNSPTLIGRNRLMVSINGALSVDLEGQVVADSRDGESYSGIGGHEDFVAGTGSELSDRSLICLPSTFARDGKALSRILPALAEGSRVTTPRHQVDVIVTEYGAAELFGRTEAERRDALIGIAHPDHREALREASAGR